MVEKPTDIDRRTILKTLGGSLAVGVGAASGLAAGELDPCDPDDPAYNPDDPTCNDDDGGNGDDDSGDPGGCDEPDEPCDPGDDDDDGSDGGGGGGGRDGDWDCMEDCTQDFPSEWCEDWCDGLVRPE